MPPFSVIEEEHPMAGFWGGFTSGYNRSFAYGVEQYQQRRQDEIQQKLARVLLDDRLSVEQKRQAVLKIGEESKGLAYRSQIGQSFLRPLLEEAALTPYERTLRDYELRNRQGIIDARTDDQLRAAARESREVEQYQYDIGRRPFEERKEQSLLDTRESAEQRARGKARREAEEYRYGVSQRQIDRDYKQSLIDARNALQQREAAEEQRAEEKYKYDVGQRTRREKEEESRTRYRDALTARIEKLDREGYVSLEDELKYWTARAGEGYRLGDEKLEKFSLQRVYEIQETMKRRQTMRPEEAVDEAAAKDAMSATVPVPETRQKPAGISPEHQYVLPQAGGKHKVTEKGLRLFMSRLATTAAWKNKTPQEIYDQTIKTLNERGYDTSDLSMPTDFKMPFGQKTSQPEKKKQITPDVAREFARRVRAELGPLATDEQIKSRLKELLLEAGYALPE